MGTRDEFLSMLDFIEKKNIKPVIDSTYELSTINDAFARMESAGQFGKIIVRISVQ